MNQSLYITKLQNYLKKLPQDDVDEIVHEIEAHFKEAMNSGRTEISIADALGHPKKLANAILLEYDISQLSDKNSLKDKLMIIARIVAIGFKNIIVAPILLAVGLLVFSAFLLVFSFYFLGGALVSAPIINSIAPALVSTGPLHIMTLPVLGIGVLFGTRKLHQLLSKHTSAIISYLIKYVKVDYKKLTI